MIWIIISAVIIMVIGVGCLKETYVWCKDCKCFSKKRILYETKDGVSYMNEECVCRKCGKSLLSRTFVDMED